MAFQTNTPSFDVQTAATGDRANAWGFAPVCHSCGIDPSSNQRLRNHNDSLRQQNEILHRSLLAAGYQRRMCEEQADGALRSAQSCKDKIDAQEEELNMARESLKHEFKLHENTEKDLELCRASERRLQVFVNKCPVTAEGLASLPENFKLGTLLQEHEALQMEHESLKGKSDALMEQLKMTWKDLQHQQSLVRELAAADTPEPKTAIAPTRCDDQRGRKREPKIWATVGCKRPRNRPCREKSAGT